LTDRRKPETTRQAQIVYALEGIGRHVIRIQSGVVRVRRGMMHLAPKGTPDLYVVGWGWLETKLEKSKPTEEQLRMHALLIAAGERVAVVRSVAEALEAVRT
jgi:hypothetical protein